MDTMTNSISTLLAKIENSNSKEFLLSSENIIGNPINTTSFSIPGGSIELNETETDEFVELDLGPSPQF